VSELKPARLEEICAKCGKPLDVRPGATFRADTAGRVWHYGCAPTASPTPTNDGEGLIEAGKRYMAAVKALFAINPETKACFAEGSPTKDQETYERFVELNEATKVFDAALNQGAGQ
jgi:ssDNA-binding Zn-finger/Zn-ribbon topoisomerase 1